MVGQISGRLPGHRRPGGSAVGAAVHAVSGVRDPDVDGLRRVAAGSGLRIKGDPRQPDHIAAVFLARVLNVRPGVGEAGDVRPGDAIVGAFPQTVAAAGAVEQDAVLVRIDHEPLAHRASGHIAADFERQRRDLPGVPSVRGTHNLSVRVPIVRIRAGRHVNAVRIDRVGRQGVHPVLVPVIPADRIGQRDPASRRLLPAVSAPDVGSGIDQVRLGFVENNARHESSARAQLHALPVVSFAACGVRLGRSDLQRADHRDQQRQGINSVKRFPYH